MFLLLHDKLLAVLDVDATLHCAEYAATAEVVDRSVSIESRTSYYILDTFGISRSNLDRSNVDVTSPAVLLESIDTARQTKLDNVTTCSDVIVTISCTVYICVSMLA